MTADGMPRPHCPYAVRAATTRTAVLNVFPLPGPQMMSVAAMLSPESSVFIGGKGPEQLAAGEQQQQGGGLGGSAASVPCAAPRGTVCRRCEPPSHRHLPRREGPPAQASSRAGSTAAAGPPSAPKGGSCSRS